MVGQNPVQSGWSGSVYFTPTDPAPRAFQSVSFPQEKDLAACRDAS